MLNLVYLPFGKGGGKIGKVKISNLFKVFYVSYAEGKNVRL